MEEHTKKKNSLSKILVASLVVVAILFALYVFITKIKFSVLGYIWLFCSFLMFVLTFSSFFFMPFGLASLFAAFANIAKLSVIAQIFIFIGTTIIVWIAICNLTETKSPVNSNRGLNGDNIIGSEAIVTLTINPPRKGRVYLLGNTWSAVASEKIEEGKKVVVSSIEGITVHVKEV